VATGDRGTTQRGQERTRDRVGGGRGADQDPQALPARHGGGALGAAPRCRVRSGLPAHLCRVPGPRRRPWSRSTGARTTRGRWSRTRSPCCSGGTSTPRREEGVIGSPSTAVPTSVAVPGNFDPLRTVAAPLPLCATRQKPELTPLLSMQGESHQRVAMLTSTALFIGAPALPALLVPGADRDLCGRCRARRSRRRCDGQRARFACSPRPLLAAAERGYLSGQAAAVRGNGAAGRYANPTPREEPWVPRTPRSAPSPTLSAACD
jgi:hypothetical protein